VLVSESAGEVGRGEEGEEEGERSEGVTERDKFLKFDVCGSGDPERLMEDGGGPLGRLRPETRFP
jgi:hypothetical protein